MTRQDLLTTSAPQDGPSPTRRNPIFDPKWNGRSTFSVEEAGCEILGLSKCSAYAAAKSGSIPTVRIGRRLIVPRLALEKLLGV
jgi:excisionase family DNA binding protein